MLSNVRLILIHWMIIYSQNRSYLKILICIKWTTKPEYVKFITKFPRIVIARRKRQIRRKTVIFITSCDYWSFKIIECSINSFKFWNDSNNTLRCLNYNRNNVTWILVVIFVQHTYYSQKQLKIITGYFKYK